MATSEECPAAGPSPVVAVQGELGCNSELAAHEYFGPDRRPHILPCASFAELFAAVRDGRAAHGMAPVENSLAGGVHPVWDLLLEHSPQVTGELYLRIGHCLIGHPGAGLEAITDVYSHPQALAQCDRYLSSLDGVRQHEVYDTAGAVKMVAERGVPGEGAIAAAQAAADYGMEILADHIETEPENYTRFLVFSARAIAPAPAARDGERLSLLVGLGDRARGLPELLARLRHENLEILKVECVKRLGQPWAYTAFIDVQAPSGRALSATVLAAAGQAEPGPCVLGPYPAGRRAEPRPVSRS